MTKTATQFGQPKQGAAKKVRTVDRGNFMDLARQLRQTLEQSPNEFMRIAKQLGVERRKAYYLVEIDRNLDGLKVDRQRLERIGWTKLQIISGHINSRNAESLLAQAEQHNAYELTRLMKREPVDAEPRENVVSLHFTGSEYDIFRAAVLAHGARASGAGIAGKEQALIAALRNLKK